MARKRTSTTQTRARQSKDDGRKQTVATVAAGGRWPIPLVLFLAGVFAVKLIVVWQLGDHPLLQPDAGLDTTTYVQLARRVLAGDAALGPGLYYMSPLYIYFLAAALAIADSFTFVRVVQCLLGTVAVACVFVTARDWSGNRAAWAAAVLAALTGVLTFYEVLLLQSALDSVLTAGALACLTRALVRLKPETTDVASGFSRTGTALAAGLLFGLEGLNRPNVLIAVAGVLAAMVAIRRVRIAAVVLSGVVLALAPVVVRNIVVAGDFALVSSQGGLNFYIGNHAGATGQYQAVPGVRASIEGQSEDTRRVAEQALGRPLADSEVSGYFTGLAWTWIREHPAAAAALFVRKLALVFNTRHQWLDFSYPYYARDTGSILGLLFVGPWLLVPLGVTGLALPVAGGTLHVARRIWLVWASFVPFYALAVAAFFVAERYRLPIFVPLCVAAGAAIDHIVAVVNARDWRRLAVPSAVALAAAAAANWPFRLDDGRFDERLRLSKVLLNNGQVGRAVVELEKAHAIDPGHTVAEFNLGMALVSDGRAAEGIPHVRRAVDARVPVNGARYALVRAMQASGDAAGAARLLQTFQPEPSDDADSCFQVALMAIDARQPEAAERYLRRAVGLRPEWGAARQQLGIVLVGLGRFEAAASELRAALDRGARDAASYGNLAYCEARLGRPAEARRLAQITLQLDPNFDLAPLLSLLGGK